MWKAIAHSAIGTRHQQLQQPCQDYSQYWIAESTIVGAIADGAGSAPYGDIGARLAVETAVKVLIPTVTTASNSTPKAGQTRLEFSETAARDLFTDLVQQVVRVLQTQAETTGAAIADLACTLLVFVATRSGGMALQIGDGFIVTGTPETQDYQLLFQPQKGEFINQTTFVTATDVLEQMQVCVDPGMWPFICAATDGLERVALRLRDWSPHPPFFQPLADCLRLYTQPGEAEAYLQAFLESERLNAYTDDDKTLLSCLYQPEL